MSPPKLCPAQFAEFMARAERVTDAVLTQEFGLSEAGVRRWRARLQVCRPVRSVRYWGCGDAGGTALPPERYDEFKRLAATWNNTKLGAHFQFAPGTARRYRTKFGIPRVFPAAARQPSTRPRGASGRTRVGANGAGRRTVLQWRCWRCNGRLVHDLICPICHGSFGQQ